jgi:predicted phosphodiesterase
MIHGTPWDSQEVALLSAAIVRDDTLHEIQHLLKSAGFNRSIEAISRKIRRLGTIKVEVIESSLAPVKAKPVVDDTPWHTGPLSLIKDRATKFVMLNDIHVPHNIPLDRIWEFVKDYKPDYMLLVGDIINNDPFDHWAKMSPRRFKVMPQPKAHYEECNETFYRPMREAVGKNCKVVHWVGNHEHWSNKAIAEMPEGEGYWEVWNNLEEVDLWVPSKQLASLGHLHFVHGDVINGGKNHSAKMMNYFRRNIRYGHYHDIQETSHTSPIDVEDRHTARACGTLEKFNPMFMENRPHDWMHAFTYGIVRPNGNFGDHTVTIIDNSFYANGKLYG